jgi:hypothetical protein
MLVPSAGDDSVEKRADTLVGANPRVEGTDKCRYFGFVGQLRALGHGVAGGLKVIPGHRHP